MVRQALPWMTQVTQIRPGSWNLIRESEPIRKARHGTSSSDLADRNTGTLSLTVYEGVSIMLFCALRAHVVTELCFGTFANVNFYFLPIAGIVADVLAESADREEALHHLKPFAQSARAATKPRRNNSQERQDAAMDDSVENGDTNAPRDHPEKVETKAREIEEDSKADGASLAGVPSQEHDGQNKENRKQDVRPGDEIDRGQYSCECQANPALIPRMSLEEVGWRSSGERFGRHADV